MEDNLLNTTLKQDIAGAIMNREWLSIFTPLRKKFLGKIATQIATQTNITSEEAALEIVEQNAKKEKSLLYKVKKAVLCYKS